MRLIYKRGAERIAFPLEEGETYIGRKEYCEIFFPDGSLSKRHARLVRKGSRLWAYDAGSRNGTLVNGQTIEEQELRNGDVLQCGKLRFQVEGLPGDGEDGDYELLSGDATRSRRSGVPEDRQPSRSRGTGVVTARAVNSGEARPSMLDVLPELPASVETAGADAATSAAAPRRRPGATLKLVEGGPSQVWQLYGETVTIGSKEENAVVIQGEGVSRYHAEVALEEGQWLLKDLGARNGVFIAGQRIDVHPLKPGDEIQIGVIKLRFELVQPGVLDGVNEVLQAVRSDPVKAFKEDQRVRMGVAAVLLAMILMLVALPAGRATGILVDGGEQANGPWMDEGSQALVEGNYSAARDVFRKAKIIVPPNSQETPRTLERIAELWMTLEQGPLKFRWSTAGEVLKKSAKLSGLPAALRDWLERQMEFVDLNAKAYDSFMEAQGLGNNATDQGRSQQVELALETFSKAIAAYEQVSSSSLLAADAGKAVEELRQRAFRLMTDHLQQRMRSPKPDWAGTLKLIEHARDFAGDASEKQTLRRLAEECETNRADEARYVAAVKLIETRILAKYPDAQRLLEQIDRRSRIFPDAQAYIDWIDADMKVRHAKRAYDIGDARQAFQFLNEAMRYEVLGPEAKTSVRQRRTAWARVVRSYERGMQLSNDQQYAEAKEELQRVLQLEPNTRNRYHMRARDQIEYIDKLQSMGLEHKLKSGLSALEDGDYANALKWFAEVREDPNHRERDLQQIRFAVAQKNQTAKLLEKGKQELLRDNKEEFLRLRDVFKLLTLWLPEGHPDRKEARKHFDSVIDRLKILKSWKAGELDPPR